MKKHFFLILVIMLFTCFAMFLTGCDGTDDNTNSDSNETSFPSHICSFSSWITIKSPSCIIDGLEQRYCIECNYTESRSINKSEHISGEWAIDKYPTCISNGSKHQICLICSKTLVTTTIDANGHTAGEWIVDTKPEINSSGLKHQICSVCNDTIRTEIIPPREYSKGLEYTLSSDGKSYSVRGIGTCSDKDIITFLSQAS